jgi:hypothetical protein
MAAPASKLIKYSTAITFVTGNQNKLQVSNLFFRSLLANELPAESSEYLGDLCPLL